MPVADARSTSPADTSLIARLWSIDLPREHGFEPLEIEGSLPVELRGTLYRNGPGLFGQRGARYLHPFEADGAITAVRFEAGRALGACKVTESDGLREERSAGRMLYGFGAPWLQRVRNMVSGRQKNTANTSVVVWRGRVFALMEAGLPTELDPQTLAVRGESRLDGAIVSWFSAHPHRVASRRALYNFGLEMGRVTRLHLYELPDAGPARHLGAHVLPGPPMLHDFIATETHLVFFVSPVRIDVPRMLLQVGGFEQMFRWRPELGTEVLCVPIDHPSDAVRFTTDAFYQWHFTNAFTRGSELVIDYVHYPTFDSFRELGALGRGEIGRSEGHAYRAVVDLTRRTLRTEQMLSCALEFPTVIPGTEGGDASHQFFALGRLAALGRLDRHHGSAVTHELPDTQCAGRPLFVPRPGPRRQGDGWLLALCHDGARDRAFVAVYDAARLAEGPCARAWFDHQIPVTFHGQFALAGAGPSDSMSAIT